jgi:4-hydroxy-3-methylbut-2-en-1-yl diphosphate reductase
LSTEKKEMKKFDIPEHFKSGIISELKMRRRVADPRKQDFSPSVLDLGNITFILPRHFGFCYGVENAIERSYKAINENPGKRIFLLSQMIHNPIVNDDLESHGLKFIMDTEGNQLMSWEEINHDDIVIIPAFGTTVETENILRDKGVEIQKYNTTCPFVEKVWKRSAEIGKKGFTIIIHGKHKHEETKATFSHSYQDAPSIIIRDMAEAKKLANYILGNSPLEHFSTEFAGKYSTGFNPETDLRHVGVVNQTTMLATETQEIADFFKSLMQEQHGENYKEHFADTRDTLCYATNDNQQSTIEVLSSGADLALVVGGYNSSNTSQIVTILSQKMPAYFIKDAEEIVSDQLIRHFDYSAHKLLETKEWLPTGKKPKIVLTSGASCPDTVLESVMNKVLSLIIPEKTVEEVVSNV